MYVLELEWGTRVLGYPRVHMRLAGLSPDKMTPFKAEDLPYQIDGYLRVHLGGYLGPETLDSFQL